MLKITSERIADSARLTLEGRLTGPWTTEVNRAWRSLTQTGAGSLVVDLTGVTFVGEDGKVLLKQMWQEGAQLIATGCCTGHLVGEITRSETDAPSARGATK